MTVQFIRDVFLTIVTLMQTEPLFSLLGLFIVFVCVKIVYNIIWGFMPQKITKMERR